MRKGSCIIDNVDIADLGMFILRGGDADFLSFPERVEPIQNDWFEFSGVDVDLSEIYFKEKTVSVNFYLTATNSSEFEGRLSKFHRLISAPGYRKMYIREFDRTFNLRYVSCPSYAHSGGLYKQGTKSGEISVQFVMDNPLQLFENEDILMPANRNDSKTFVSINNIELTNFGVIVNQCYDTVLSLSAAKVPLIRNFDRHTGLEVYPSSVLRLQNKQIVIDCMMIANSLDEFYHNYMALFNNLRKKEALKLTTLYEDFECYYSSMQNFQKLEPFSSRIKMQFSIVLTIVKPNEPITVLNTEDDFCIVTEEGVYLIAM